MRSNLARRLAAAETRLAPTRILVAKDSADADRIEAEETGNFVIIITGVPRRC
jgi:hypothetical protein